MNLTLFQISEQYLEAMELLGELDLPEEVINDTLQGLRGDLDIKSTNVAMFVRNIEASAQAIKHAEEQMAKRRKAMENRIERLKEYLKYQMEAVGISKIECPYFKLSIKTNPHRVVVDDESKIPEKYFRPVEPPEPQPDKTAIKAALKNGEDVPGVHLEQSNRLSFE